MSAPNPIFDRLPASIVHLTPPSTNPETRTLFIMRGVPGTGKSTRARFLLTAGVDPRDHIVSADDHHTYVRTEDGNEIPYLEAEELSGTLVYRHTPEKVPVAHLLTQQKAHELMCRRQGPVIVDNTHTGLYEMRPYVFMGLLHGYEVVVVEIDPSRLEIGELIALCNSRPGKTIPERFIEKARGNLDASLLSEMPVGRLESILDVSPQDYPPFITRSSFFFPEVYDVSTANLGDAIKTARSRIGIAFV